MLVSVVRSAATPSVDDPGSPAPIATARSNASAPSLSLTARTWVTSWCKGAEATLAICRAVDGALVAVTCGATLMPCCLSNRANSFAATAAGSSTRLLKPLTARPSSTQSAEIGDTTLSGTYDRCQPGLTAGPVKSEAS
jgi:hypothetical protein